MYRNTLELKARCQLYEALSKELKPVIDSANKNSSNIELPDPQLQLNADYQASQANLRDLLTNQRTTYKNLKLRVSQMFDDGVFVSSVTMNVSNAIKEYFGSDVNHSSNSEDLPAIGKKDRVMANIEIESDNRINLGYLNNTPIGSYINTCDIINNINGVVVATCKNNDGKLNTSTLALDSLRPGEEIINTNGELSGGDTYHASCSYGRYDAPNYNALCTDSNNTERPYQLNYGRDCADGSSISFKNNKLVCDKYRYSFQSQCERLPQYSTENIIAADCNGTTPEPGNPTSSVFIDINTDDCAYGSDIIYANGKLMCAQYKPATALPAQSRDLYLQSCKALPDKSIGSVISADCSQSTGGNPMDNGFVSLDTSLCASDSTISARNGFLVCSHYINKVPQGSYMNTCSISGYDQGKLYAVCLDDYGKMVASKLDYLNDCSGQNVTNHGGVLECN